MQLPKTIHDVVQHLARLNGVGERTALRHCLQMTKWSPESILEMAQSLEALTQLNHCRDCGAFSEESLCSICNQELRQEKKTICVVEGITDLFAIERSGQFLGTYHILGGVLNPLAGITPDKLRIQELLTRVEKRQVEELVMAINPTVEGDATCSYLKELLPDFVSMKRIGFGVPIGGNLEFLDPLTIMKAFENKRGF
ncbi:MAG: recombination protein RecR [Halobacteriovoraceae bacterium]|nr:recombination protein RecR [Halobacteriovoraceae bacterium]